MQHTDRSGNSKLLSACTLPITGVKCVKKVVTDLAVLEVDPNGRGFILKEVAPGVTVEQVKAATQGILIIEGEIPEMVL